MNFVLKLICPLSVHDQLQQSLFLSLSLSLSLSKSSLCRLKGLRLLWDGWEESERGGGGMGGVEKKRDPRGARQIDRGETGRGDPRERERERERNKAKSFSRDLGQEGQEEIQSSGTCQSVPLEVGFQPIIKISRVSLGSAGVICTIYCGVSPPRRDVIRSDTTMDLHIRIPP